MTHNRSQTSTREVYQALKDTIRVMLHCEYFQRLWVVHEVLLTQSVFFLWGEQTVRYHYLKEPLTYVSQSTLCDRMPWASLKCCDHKSLDGPFEILTATLGLHCADEQNIINSRLTLAYNKRRQWKF